MSLVDYGSSDEDEVENREEERESLEATKDDPPPPPPPPSPSQPQTQRLGPSSNPQSSGPSAVKLPDASFLLNSPITPSHLVSSYDHSSRVAAAMAESASRKREADGFTPASSRHKVPRGTLLNSRSVPQRVGGLLVPPQLSGRSNIVTEDISKLFVRKKVEPSSQ